MPEEKKESGAAGGDDRPFGGKVDDIVAKAIPQKWLATAFAGAAGGALLFFILMIVGFAMDGEPATPEEAKAQIKKLQDEADAKVDKYEEMAKKARGERDEAKKGSSETQSKLRAEERKFSSAESNVKNADARRDKLQTAFDDLKKRYGDLETKLAAATRDTRTAESKLRTAERDRDAAKGRESAISTRLKRTETGLTDLQREHASLSRKKEDDSVRLATAKATFESIMNNAAAEDDLVKRLALLRQMRDESLDKLGGTAYTRSLGDEIIGVEQLIDKQATLAKKKSTRKANEAYKDAFRRLKMTKEHASAMAILREAREEVAGTDYEVRIHQEMESREKAEKTRLARVVYDAAMKNLRAQPGAHEANLEALKRAVEETEGTAYSLKLKRLVDARGKSLVEDIGRGAYESLSAQLKKTPTDHDANITAAEDALAKAKSTRYEAKVTSMLKEQQTRRLTAIGRAAYDACIKQVKGSRDYAANVAELEAQKAKSSGSAYGAKIDKLLAGQRKYLARERARNE